MLSLEFSPLLSLGSALLSKTAIIIYVVVILAAIVAIVISIMIRESSRISSGNINFSLGKGEVKAGEPGAEGEGESGRDAWMCALGRKETRASRAMEEGGAPLPPLKLQGVRF